MAKVIKIRVTKPQMEKICERIAEGESLTRICNNTKTLPSWRTVLRWVQENDEAHVMYRKGRALQCDEFDGVLVMGGDGTLHEAVNGLMSRDDY